MDHSSTSTFRRVFSLPVIVAALGYFVDIYDLVLFSIVRVPSLQALGVSGKELTDHGVDLLNMQMAGMLVGGIIWGVLGDRKGRLRIMFGPIFLYSVANIQRVPVMLRYINGWGERMIVTNLMHARMLTPHRRCALVLFLAGALLLPVPAGAEEKEQKRPLVVYGDKFMFVIQEPDGWNADLENAGKLSAGVVLVRAGETFEKHGVLIAIRIAKKVDEDTKEDLGHDMREFRKLYPDVQFKDLKAPHPAYASHAKLFAISRSRHDYVTYLNPGPGAPVLFAVTMTTGKREADKNDLQAYRDVVRSLEFIPQEGAAPLR